jgi:hypothetical protein
MNLLWPTCGPYVPRISSHPFSRLIRTYAAWRGAPCHFSSLKSQSFTSAKDRNARARARHNAGNLWLITSDDVRIFLKFSPIAPIKEDVKRRRKVSSPPLSLSFSLLSAILQHSGLQRLRRPDLVMKTRAIPRLVSVSSGLRFTVSLRNYVRHARSHEWPKEQFSKARSEKLRGKIDTPDEGVSSSWFLIFPLRRYYGDSRASRPTTRVPFSREEAEYARRCGRTSRDKAGVKLAISTSLRKGEAA